jgi:hypothetical protein
LCTALKINLEDRVAFFGLLNKVVSACWLCIPRKGTKLSSICRSNNGQQAMQQKAKSPPRSIADMAIYLADTVPELGNDELCRIALRHAGVPPFYANRWEVARDLARAARAAKAELWAIVLSK